jgi:hypothetical protein
MVRRQGEADTGVQGARLNPLGPLLDPPGPLLTHLHTVYIAYSECLPTRLTPLAEGACSSQVRLLGPFVFDIARYHVARSRALEGWCARQPPSSVSYCISASRSEPAARPEGGGRSAPRTAWRTSLPPRRRRRRGKRRRRR